MKSSWHVLEAKVKRAKGATIAVEARGAELQRGGGWSSGRQWRERAELLRGQLQARGAVELQPKFKGEVISFTTRNDSL